MATDKTKNKNYDQLGSEQPSTSGPNQRFEANHSNITSSIVDVKGNAYQNIIQYVNSQEHASSENADFGKIKQRLWQKAEEISGTIDHSVETVNKVGFGIPELTTKLKTQSSEDKSTNSNPKGNVQIECIFQEAKQASIQLQNATNKHAEKRQIEKHGNVVIALGQPGVGKSTFTKVFLGKVVKRSILKETSFIFYIQIRSIDFSKNTNLISLLLCCCLSDIQLTDNQMSDLAELLRNDPNLLIILDGLDEANVETFTKVYPSVSLHPSQAHPMAIIANLLSGNIFPQAKKLVTSRPEEFFELPPEIRPMFFVEVCGFSEETQKEIGKQVCGDQYEEVQNKLQQNAVIGRFCYIPLLFILIHNYLLINPNTGFISMTDILSYYYAVYSRSKHCHKKEAQPIAKLAWCGIIKQQYQFTQNDLKEAGIDRSSFLHTSPSASANLNLQVLHCDKISFFSHRIWQDYFAACHLIFFQTVVEFKESVSQLMKSFTRDQMIFTFLFGLCNKNTIGEENMTSHEIPEKREVLFSHIPNIFVACRWASEAQDEEVKRNIFSKFPKSIDVEYVTVYPNDVSSFFHYTQKYGKVIDMISGKFNGNSFDLFELAIKQNNLKMICVESTVFLSENKFAQLPNDWLNKDRDSAISYIYFLPAAIALSAVNSYAWSFGYTRDLFRNSLSIKAYNLKHVDVLVDTLKGNLFNPSINLDVSGCKVGNRGLQLIASSGLDIARLKINNCGITKIGEEMVAATKKWKVLVIDISYNQIGDDGGRQVKKMMQASKELRFVGCGISEELMEELEKHQKKLHSAECCVM